MRKKYSSNFLAGCGYEAASDHASQHGAVANYLLKNSKTIDANYVRLVEENFWSLLL